MKLGYLNGILEAEEKLRAFGGDTRKAYQWLNDEARAIGKDYRWSSWLNGANDYLVHFIKSNIKPISTAIN
ncbi:hypothetical protein [Vibrio comitans]|uniref:Uncharacterized protein n=1 Tax=Vibrio comitans NBRC 102076 TaxID=1219078 RepID=A0A4Y3IHG9_9VIBR|nr:hypothetical protein [Vibrio comitans]GEA58847.1 hypothetical protein VCO01S_00400 [Vibrio comitans NBRC 102076]